MGLTIHYSLRAGSISAGRAREMVQRLRHLAVSLAFDQVTDVVEVSHGSGRKVPEDLADFARYLTIRAGHALFVATDDQDEETVVVEPVDLIAFSALPGEGCEHAPIGLATYPPRTTRRGRTVPTGLDGWRWWGCCKTQYASNPAVGGTEAFLACHLRLVSLLDEAAGMGVLGEVTDESGYWEKRDVGLLAKEVARWTAVMAAAVGALQDGLEQAGVDRKRIVSEITAYPDFEHLEAKGRLGGTDRPRK